MNNYKGFNNIGNTCYLNSALQLAINNKQLCIQILNSENEELNDFIIEYYNKGNLPLTPRFIKDMISQKFNKFNDFNQHDSFEFLLYLIDFLDIKLYEITANVIIKCKLNNCIKNISEKNNFLMLNINDEFTTLDDCYRNYKATEHIPYKCDICNSNSIISKKTEITNWPNNLIIVLKRFNNNLNKITKPIDMPILWRHNYILTGFIHHSGNLNGGHYVYIGNKNNTWFMFNDSSVSELNNLDNYKNTSYIYHYSKVC